MKFGYLERPTRVNKSVRAAFRQAVPAWEGQVRELLPQLSGGITYWLTSEHFVIPELQCGGFAHSPGNLTTAIDSEVNNWETIELPVKHIIYHELHHLARNYTYYDAAGNPLIKPLQELLVAEGMATCFERDFGGSQPPYGQYDEAIVRDWLDELHPFLKGTDFDQSQIFFSHPDGRRWIGYRVGTFIVDQALANYPNESAATLVQRPAEEILGMAGLLSS